MKLTLQIFLYTSIPATKAFLFNSTAFAGTNEATTSSQFTSFISRALSYY